AGSGLLNFCGRDCVTVTDGETRGCDRCEQAFKASKLVYRDGDGRPAWIRLSPDESETRCRDTYRKAVSKACEVCEGSLTGEPYTWVHCVDGVAQCPGCRETMWLADGYEIDDYGLPSCWNYEHTREQRIAERTLTMLLRATPAWKESAKGKEALGK